MTNKINYQLMEEAMDGKYYPDYKKLIAGATCKEEVEYIKKVENGNHGFAFNMVYITRQSCGHFEIFQSPQNEYYTLKEVLEQGEQHSKEHKCTKCTCNW